MSDNLLLLSKELYWQHKMLFASLLSDKKVQKLPPIPLHILIVYTNC